MQVSGIVSPQSINRGRFAYAGTEPGREGLAVELYYQVEKQKKSRPREEKEGAAWLTPD